MLGQPTIMDQLKLALAKMQGGGGGGGNGVAPVPSGMPYPTGPSGIMDPNSGGGMLGGGISPFPGTTAGLPSWTPPTQDGGGGGLGIGGGGGGNGGQPGPFPFPFPHNGGGGGQPGGGPPQPWGNDAHGIPHAIKALMLKSAGKPMQAAELWMNRHPYAMQHGNIPNWIAPAMGAGLPHQQHVADAHGMASQLAQWLSQNRGGVQTPRGF